MNIKYRLQNYSKLQKEVNQLSEQVLTLRQRMYSIKSSSDMSMVPASGGNNDKIASIVARVADLENMYLHKIDDLMQEQRDIEKIIENLEPIEKLLIRSRYIECNTWESICGIIGYSWKQTHRIHSKTLSKMQQMQHTGKF